MKLSRNLRWTLVTLLAVFIGALAGGMIFRGEYLSSQTVRRSFTIDQNFTAVRKILRKEGTEQIITLGGDSEFISQHWTAGGVDVDEVRLIGSEWRLELHGNLRVRTRDDYIGEQVLELAQEVEIEPDFLHSEVKLKEPAERLKNYAMTTHFERDEASGQSRVDLKLTQDILTDAPWFAHGIADRRVRASAAQTLENQEAAIRTLIADNIDDVPLLPLR